MSQPYLEVPTPDERKPDKMDQCSETRSVREDIGQQLESLRNSLPLTRFAGGQDWQPPEEEPAQ